MQVGRAGEEIAATYLSEHGYFVLDRNWRGGKALARASGERRNHGELDVVALKGETLVGIEVKTRSTIAFGHPAAALSADKVARLRRLLGQWLTENRGRIPKFTQVRLDAITIVLNPRPEFTHYEGIV
jgi:putative endonuclease